MKTKRKLLDSPLIILVISLTGFAASVLADDPRTSSWFTADTGKYARIYTNDAAKATGTSVTSWSNGTQTQSLAAYSGVQEISSSSNWVYIRSTGLGAHIMGPWLNGSFPNLPINTKTFWRIPHTNTVPTTKTLTGNGVIGYFVDGVGMFDSRDAFYWNGATNTQGTGYWNRDAYVNEGATFDPAYAHQPQDGTYHYHADPIALRSLLGDHVDYNNSSKTYSESTNPITKHSPILAWVGDGCPLYGPYGYSNATNPASSVRRMVSGYVLRNGQLGTSNLNNGRTTIPQWAVRLYNNVASNILAGPAVASYQLGCYMEDNDYLGDLGYQQGVDFDLDVYNGRWCVTPEFPLGVYAYFVSISSNGTPVFPYNIGRAYYGGPTGGPVSNLSETVVTNFEGGPNSALTLSPLALTNGTVTLAWSSVDGGTYQVQSTTSFSNGWTTNLTGVASQGLTTRINLSSSAAAAFFGVALTSLATYDPVSGSAGGGGATSVVPGGSASRNSSVTVTITLPTVPPWPPASAPVSSVKLAGTITATGVSDPTQGTVTATFAIPANAPTGAQTVQVIFNNGPTYTFTGGFTIN